MLFLLQQGEPATLDLEKLVSTVSAQKLVLETPAGKVSSLPNHLPSSHITPKSTHRVRLFSAGHGHGFCSLAGSILSLAGPRAGCWNGALNITSLADMRVMGSAEAAAASSLLWSEVSIKSRQPWSEMPSELLSQSTGNLGPAVAPALATWLGNGCQGRSQAVGGWWGHSPGEHYLFAPWLRPGLLIAGGKPNRSRARHTVGAALLLLQATVCSCHEPQPPHL